MAAISINIHCTSITARADSSGGTHWVSLIFEREGDEARTEIAVFFEDEGMHRALADHINAAIRDRAAQRAYEEEPVL